MTAVEAQFSTTDVSTTEVAVPLLPIISAASVTISANTSGGVDGHRRAMGARGVAGDGRQVAVIAGFAGAEGRRQRFAAGQWRGKGVAQGVAGFGAVRDHGIANHFGQQNACR